MVQVAGERYAVETVAFGSDICSLGKFLPRIEGESHSSRLKEKEKEKEYDAFCPAMDCRHPRRS